MCVDVLEPKEIIKSLDYTGHLRWSPENPEGRNLKDSDIGILSLEDEVVKCALRSRSRMQAFEYAVAVQEYHNREPDFDGLVGPAMKDMLSKPRCYVPDYAPPKGAEFHFEDRDIQQVALQMQMDAEARGTGNWPGCHGVGNFHACAILVDTSNIGNHLKPVFKEALSRVRKAGALLGILRIFVDKDTGKDMFTGKVFEGSINIDFSFVSRSSGWIGLAIVGHNQRCGDRIWCKYLNRYTGGSTTESIIQQWVTLINHELGHNDGEGHIPGRFNKMNPYIITGLPWFWDERDATTPRLKAKYGGEAIDLDDPDPDPDPKPKPDLERRVELLEAFKLNTHVRDAVQDAQILALNRRLEKLEN